MKISENKKKIFKNVLKKQNAHLEKYFPKISDRRHQFGLRLGLLWVQYFHVENNLQKNRDRSSQTLKPISSTFLILPFHGAKK